MAGNDSIRDFGFEPKPSRALEVSPASRFGDRPAVSLAELAALQGVGPIRDLSEVCGGWPGEPNDGLEEAIHRMRQAGIAGAPE